jgi:hypothetical protein
LGTMRTCDTRHAACGMRQACAVQCSVVQ